eukprot:6181649-Pleurochrysis_carterae.AAC.1
MDLSSGMTHVLISFTRQSCALAILHIQLLNLTLWTVKDYISSFIRDCSTEQRSMRASVAAVSVGVTQSKLALSQQAARAAWWRLAAARSGAKLNSSLGIGFRRRGTGARIGRAHNFQRLRVASEHPALYISGV